MGKSGSFESQIPPLNPASDASGLGSQLCCGPECGRNPEMPEGISQELTFKHRYFYGFNTSPTHHMGESLCVLSMHVINFLQSGRAPKKAQVGMHSKPVGLAIPWKHNTVCQAHNRLKALLFQGSHYEAVWGGHIVPILFQLNLVNKTIKLECFTTHDKTSNFVLVFLPSPWHGDNCLPT